MNVEIKINLRDVLEISRNLQEEEGSMIANRFNNNYEEECLAEILVALNGRSIKKAFKQHNHECERA